MAALLVENAPLKLEPYDSLTCIKVHQMSDVTLTARVATLRRIDAVDQTAVDHCNLRVQDFGFEGSGRVLKMQE